MRVLENEEKLDERSKKVLEELSKLPQDATIHKILSTKNLVILVAEGNIGRLIGKNGRNIKQVSEKTGCKIKVLQKTGVLDTVADLVYPARIISTSKLYLPEGEKRRIILSKEDKRKLRMKKEEVEKIVKDIYDKDIEIVFE